MRFISKQQRRVLRYPWSRTYLSSLIGGLQNRDRFKDITTYLFFIGYPRSGHSLVGSLLDAHPEMVISNQLDALSLFRHGYSRNQVFHLILENAKAEAKAGRSNTKYDYSVAGQWQGNYRRLVVIGDKRGGKTSALLHAEDTTDQLNTVELTTQLPLRAIHVIRNPYDNISTMVRRATLRPGRVLNDELIKEKIDGYFKKAAINQQLLRRQRLRTTSIHLEDLTNNPKVILEQLLGFLDLPAPKDYLEACAQTIWPAARASRQSATFWTPAYKELVSEQMRSYDFLSRYSF